MATQARTADLPARRLPRVNVVPLIGLALVALLGVWLVVNLVKTPDQFLNAFLIGVTNGSVYGLVALGYTLVYGILELINFAHGDVFMLGGMISISVISEVFGLNAASRSWAVARIALPCFVRRTSQRSAASTGMVSRTTIRLAHVYLSPLPNVNTFPCGRKSAAPLGPVLSWTKFGPFHASAMFWRMNEAAIAVISGTSRGWPRSGL